ncbi:MAG: PD40 domain-containing protein, partial [Deltaproteobacteria bacterium]|nr:PD40 domain-containing protein [Deltaproteobacteria bacterium]
MKNNYRQDVLEYMKMPSIGGHQPYMDISKDGQYILFNSNDTGKPNLYVQAVETPADIRRITAAEKMVYVGKFSPDGKMVVFSLEAHGSEKSDLYLVRLDSLDSPPKKITRKACMTYSQGIAWRPSGTEVIRTFTDGDNSGIEVIDMETLTPKILVDGVSPLMSARYSHDGKWIACTAYDSNSSIFLVNREKPEKTKTIKLSETCFNASPSWSFDDKNIGFITNINGFFQPVVYNLENDKYDVIDLLDGEESAAHSQVAQEIEFHSDVDRIYYVVSKTGRKYIKEYTISTKRSVVLPFPEGTIDAFVINPSSQIIVAIHSSMKSPKMI